VTHPRAEELAPVGWVFHYRVVKQRWSAPMDFECHDDSQHQTQADGYQNGEVRH